MNWISLDDLVGVFRIRRLTDVHGGVDGVAANPLSRKDFTDLLPALRGPDRMATPPVGPVFRHPDPDAAVHHVLGRK